MPWASNFPFQIHLQLILDLIMSMCCTFSLIFHTLNLMFLSFFPSLLLKASLMVVGASKLYLMMTIDLQMLKGHDIIVGFACVILLFGCKI